MKILLKNMGHSLFHFASSRLCVSVIVFIAVVSIVATASTCADQTLLKTHCAKCHTGAKPKGEFNLRALGQAVDAKNRDLWTNSLDYVQAGEMPPAKQSRLSSADRQRLVRYFQEQLRRYDGQAREG